MHGAHTCNHPATKTHLEPVAAGPEESTPATHTPTRLEQAAMGPERLNTYSRTPTWLGRPTRLEPAAVGSRQTRITVSPPIDRLLLAKMSETNFRSCAPILGFLPDFATDFGFLTLGFRRARARARPPTCACRLDGCLARGVSVPNFGGGTIYVPSDDVPSLVDSHPSPGSVLTWHMFFEIELADLVVA